MSLFFNEQPIVINSRMAKLIGLNESIILQQIHYWIEINRKAKKNFRNGRYWTYNTYDDWKKENFDFWSLNTIIRTISKLVKNGYLITDNFNKKGYDRTKWYTIDYEKMESLEKSLETLENTDLPILSKSVFSSKISIKEPEDSKSPETLENTHLPKMGKSTTQNEQMDLPILGRPIPENNSEIYAESQVQSSQVIEREQKSDRTRQDKINPHTNIKNLKDEKEILEYQKEIIKLKNELKKFMAKEKKEFELTDLHSYEFYKELIQDNIEYSVIQKFYSGKRNFLALLNSFIDIMAETMSSQKKEIKISSRDINQALVSKRFEAIRQEHIFFAINQYREYAQRSPIRFPKQYILTCIYNASYEAIPSEFTNKEYFAGIID